MKKHLKRKHVLAGVVVLSSKNNVDDQSYDKITELGKLSIGGACMTIPQSFISYSRNFERMFTSPPPVMCHMSRFMCYVSRAIGHGSEVTCHVS